MALVIGCVEPDTIIVTEEVEVAPVVDSTDLGVCVLCTDDGGILVLDYLITGEACNAQSRMYFGSRVCHWSPITDSLLY